MKWKIKYIKLQSKYIFTRKFWLWSNKKTYNFCFLLHLRGHRLITLSRQGKEWPFDRFVPVWTRECPHHYPQSYCDGKNKWRREFCDTTSKFSNKNMSLVCAGNCYSAKLLPRGVPGHSHFLPPVVLALKLFGEIFFFQNTLILWKKKLHDLITNKMILFSILPVTQEYSNNVKTWEATTPKSSEDKWETVYNGQSNTVLYAEALALIFKTSPH